MAELSVVTLLFGAPVLRADGELDRTLAGFLVQMDRLRRQQGKRLCSGEARFADMRVTVALAVVGQQYFVVCLN